MAKGRISKQVTRIQSMPNFPKNEHFLPPDTHTYVCVSGGKKHSFFRKFGMLCILVTSVLRFALLPYYRKTNEFCQPTVVLFRLISPSLEVLQYPPLSSLNVLPVICYLFSRTLGAVFNPEISFIIKATKWPASADSARAIVSDAIELLVTLSNFFNSHVIGTALLLPHRNTI